MPESNSSWKRSRAGLDSSTAHRLSSTSPFWLPDARHGLPVKNDNSNRLVSLRRAESKERDGSGTTWRRNILRQTATLPEHSCSNQPAEHMSKVRILVADDHAGARDLVKGILEPTFEVIGTVDNGKALVETARRLHPDVIITDISMPILN